MRHHLAAITSRRSMIQETPRSRQARPARRQTGTIQAISRTFAVLALMTLPACSGAPAAPSRHTPSPAPSPTASSSRNTPSSYQEVARQIAHQGFSIESGSAASAAGPLRAFIVICQGSADGHCGGVDFFYNETYAGILAGGRTGSLTINGSNARIVSQGGTTVVLDLPL